VQAARCFGLRGCPRTGTRQRCLITPISTNQAPPSPAPPPPQPAPRHSPSAPVSSGWLMELRRNTSPNSGASLWLRLIRGTMELPGVATSTSHRLYLQGGVCVRGGGGVLNGRKGGGGMVGARTTQLRMHICKLLSQ
jgi:hypothetical protein